MAYIVLHGVPQELTIHGRAQGQVIDNVIHFVPNVIDGDPQSDQVLIAFTELWEAEMLPLQHASYTFIRGELKSIVDVALDSDGKPRPVYGNIEVRDMPAGTIGGNGAASDTTNTTANVYKKSSGTLSTIYKPRPPLPLIATEKIFKGRVAFGPLGEDQTDSTAGNVLDATYRNAVDAAFAQLVALEITSLLPPFELVMSMVIMSMIRNKAPRPAAAGAKTIAFQTVADVVVQPFAGSQNSRKPRNEA